MTKIKAILFDIDGVIVYPKLQFAKYLDKKRKVSKETTKPFFQGVFNQCLTGKKDLKKVLPPYLEKWGYEKGVDSFVRLWLKKDDFVDKRIIKEIKKIKKAGYICCTSSNQEKNRAKYLKEEKNFNDLFHNTFFSCDLGYIKPQQGFFKTIQNRLSLNPNEILFIDDSKEFVKAAEKIKWNTAIYNKFNDLKNIYKKFNIDIQSK